jgi:phenylacetate-CoA ligase
MLLISMLRTGLRYWRGQRPHVEDMDQIVRYMRDRRARGLPAVPGNLAGGMRGFGGSRSSEQLQKLQARKLRRTVEYVYRYVPFYRESMDATGVKPDDIRSLADVHKLPITRRDQLCENNRAFVSRYPGLIPALAFQTGGTTGKPVQVYVTNEELQYYAAGEAITGMMMGWLGPEEIMQRHFSSEPSVTGTILTAAAHKAGALVIVPDHSDTLDDHVESIFGERDIPGKKRKVSLLMISPAHLWALTSRAEEMGVDFSESGLRRIQTGGALVTADLKERVLDTWGIALHEGFGLTEVFSCAAGECDQSDRLHFTDMTGYAEALDPKTAEPVPPGEPGVLAITTFYPDRDLMPLLRYWTDDLVILSPERTCACGVPTTQIVSIVGRVDHMVTVGVRNFYPQAIGDSLLDFPELVLPPRFRLRTEQRKDAQYAILDVEVKEGIPREERERLVQRIQNGIILSRYWEVRIGVVNLVVDLRSAGSIEHPFPYKHADLVLTRRDE